MHKLLTLLIFILLIITLRAESSYFGEYLISYPKSVGSGLQQPLKWQGEQWLLASGIVLSIGALYVVDEEIRGFAQDNKSDLSQNIMQIGKQFGEGKYVLPAIGTSILGGYIAGSEKTMDTGLLCLKSFVLSQGVTQSLKLLTQRYRPSAGRGKELFNGNGISRKRDSFPSGHSTIAWSIAPILAEQYQQQRWVAPVAYGVAGLCSISRVHDNNHWSSDVLTGALIGYFAAKLVLNSTPRLELSPLANAEGLGFRFYF